MAAIKKILVLGAGPVSAQVVEYLHRSPTNNITITALSLQHALRIASRFRRSTALSLNVNSPELDAYVAAHDIVLSLIPPNLHPTVIRAAIRQKRDFVCTSFARPELLSLDALAQQAGITVITEVGVAPGLDHIYAVKAIEKIHSAGGKVISFSSFVGGLPAPECSNNPLRIKFSWNPKNTILSQIVPTSYLEDGHVVNIAGKDLMDSARPISIDDSRYQFVGFGSGSSIPFREHYNIPEALTAIRGTLRYKENPIMISTLYKIGWLDALEKNWLTPDANLSWAQVTQRLMGTDTADEQALADRAKVMPHFRNVKEAEDAVDGLRWIGLFSADPVPVKAKRLVDILCVRLEELCKWNPGERDMIMLQHRFGIIWPDGAEETRTLTFELLGEPDRHTAMGKSTGVTCGIATQLLLDGHSAFNKPGLLRPYTTDVCEPIRQRLEVEGLVLVERLVEPQ